MQQVTIIGNWKMNATRDSCRQWFETFHHKWNQLQQTKSCSHLHWVTCPPAPYLATVLDHPLRESGLNFSIGAQHAHIQDKGAFTGDVSSHMLADLGCQYVLCGHSERRQAYKESCEETRARAQTVLQHDMVPVVCVGEDRDIRNMGQAEDWVLNQAKESMPDGDVILAYEPVWAIGQGQTPSNDDLARMMLRLRKGLTGIKALLYGGSVTDANARSLMRGTHIDGFLVGGASLDPTRFLKIGDALLD